MRIVKSVASYFGNGVKLSKKDSKSYCSVAPKLLDNNCSEFNFR